MTEKRDPVSSIDATCTTPVQDGILGDETSNTRPGCGCVVPCLREASPKAVHGSPHASCEIKEVLQAAQPCRMQ